MTTINQDSIEILEQQTNEFTGALQKIFEKISGKNIKILEAPTLTKTLEIEAELIVSIFYVGSVFGEFIVSLSKSAATEILQNQFPGMKLSDQDLSDGISEALNMASGNQLKSLTKHFSKLTITSPRSSSGNIHYPSVRAMRSTLSLGDHHIFVCFYLDEMKLDISESYKNSIQQLKSANQELLEANEKLKLQQIQLIQSEKMASLGTMAAGVAHEINNPLSFVISNADILSSYVNAFQDLFSAFQRLIVFLHEKKSKEAINELRNVRSLQEEKDIPYIMQDTINLMNESKSGLDRIKKIVNSLKLFSRVDDSGAKTVQLNEEFRNVMQLLGNELKYRCQVQFDAGDIPEIECIPFEIGQVFVNLMMNAAQAMPESEGKISVCTSYKDNFVTIKVQDNGHGITNENLNKIFDPFFTTKPVGQGTGLGLAISHSIIKKHGGSIHVESELNKGTVFTIHLPLKMPKGMEEV